MNTIVLEPWPGATPAELATILQGSGLHEGSEVFIRRLRIMDDDAWKAVLILTMVGIAVVQGLARVREMGAVAEKVENDAWSAELLARMYAGVGDVAALEREIEERTGVTITIDETEEWPTAGMYLLDRAYGDDEIDISGIELREPNPDYEP